MKKKFLLIFFILTLTNINLSFGSNIFILTTVDDEIITNIDIQKEADYLRALNPSLTNLKKEQILKISKSSLIKEIIKKKEIKKIFDLNKKNSYLDESLKDVYTKLNFNNENDFKVYLKQSTNYSLDDVKKKLKIEIMWNELVYYRYAEQVKIDKKKLLKKINNLSNEIIKEYQLSEIVIKRKKDENLNDLFNKINSSILETGFNNSANIYSISDSSKLGGRLGWINENNLSELVSIKLKDIVEGQHTQPIQIGNDYLILKVEKIRKKNITINKDEELSKMIKFETNKQLNQFSKIFYDKSVINYSINEK